jgi:DNA-binding transcriptional regulator YdaS (Cro superfamily)
MPRTPQDAVVRAIRAKRGLPARIARHLGIKPQAVLQWGRVPAEHVVEIADLVGMSPSQIRPDVFKRVKRRA